MVNSLRVDIYERTVEKLGPFWANVFFYIGLAGFVAVSVTAIITCVSTINPYFKDYVGAPLLRMLPAALQWIRSPWAIGIFSALILYGFIYFLVSAVKYILGEQVHLARGAAAILGAQEEQAQALADVAKRVTKLENHTDISGEHKEFMELLVQRAMNNRLTIHKALYGAREIPKDKWRDVATILEFFNKNGKLEMPVSGYTLGGDLLPGVNKTLEVVYTVGDGPERIATFPEGSTCVLPQPIPGTLGALLNIAK